MDLDSDDFGGDNDSDYALSRRSIQNEMAAHGRPFLLGLRHDPEKCEAVFRKVMRQQTLSGNQSTITLVPTLTRP